MNPLDRLKIKEERRRKSIENLEHLRANPDPDMVVALKRAKLAKPHHKKKP